MAERLVRDLAIEEALQEEIKYTIEGKNHVLGKKLSLPASFLILWTFGLCRVILDL